MNKENLLQCILMTPNICNLVLKYFDLEDIQTLLYSSSHFLKIVPNKLKTLETTVHGLAATKRIFSSLKDCHIKLFKDYDGEFHFSTHQFPSLQCVSISIYDCDNGCQFRISVLVKKLEFYLDECCTSSFVISVPESLSVLNITTCASIVQNLVKTSPNLTIVKICMTDFDNHMLDFYQVSLKKLSCEARKLVDIKIHSIENLESLSLFRIRVSLGVRSASSKLRCLQLKNQIRNGELIGNTKFPQLHLYEVSYKNQKQKNEANVLRVFEECILNTSLNTQSYTVRMDEIIEYKSFKEDTRYFYANRLNGIQDLDFCSRKTHIFMHKLHDLKSLTFKKMFGCLHWSATFLKFLELDLTSGNVETFRLVLTGRQIESVRLKLSIDIWNKLDHSLLSSSSYIDLILSDGGDLFVHDMQKLKKLRVSPPMWKKVNVKFRNLSMFEECNFEHY